MRKNTFFALAAVAALTFALTGCGNNTKGTTTIPSTTNEEITAEIEETPVVTEEPTTETEETTVDVTETAPSEETASEETTTEEPTVEAELPSFGDKTLVITAMGESVDILHEPVDEVWGYIAYDAYAEDPATFDFEVLGIKGSQDISTKDALINAFIDYFGEPVYVINDFDDDDASYDLYSVLYVWEYAEGELSLNITAYGESRDVIDSIDIKYRPE